MLASGPRPFAATWLPNDVNRLRHLIAAHKTSVQIGILMGRSESAIRNKCQMLGLEPWHKHRWTHAREEWLRRLVAEELTAREAAAQMHITRNAAIGKAGRMGLLWKGSPPKRPLLDRVTEYARPRHKPKPAPQEATMAVDPPPDRSPLRPPVLFAHSGPHHCRWPLGAPAWNMPICGERVVEGYSYCRAHCRMAYVRTPGARRSHEAVREGVA